MQEWCSARKACHDFFSLAIPWGVVRIITSDEVISKAIGSRNCFTLILNFVLLIGLFALLICVVALYLPLLLVGCGCSMIWLRGTVQLRLNNKSVLAPKCSELLHAAHEEAQTSVNQLVSSLESAKWTDPEFPPTPEGCLYPNIECVDEIDKIEFDTFSRLSSPTTLYGPIQRPEGVQLAISLTQEGIEMAENIIQGYHIASLVIDLFECAVFREFGTCYLVVCTPVFHLLL
jgi:hypothetical protein